MLDAECGMNSVTTLPYAAAAESTLGGEGRGGVYPLYASSLAEQMPPMPRRRGPCKKCLRWEAPRGVETQVRVRGRGNPSMTRHESSREWRLIFSRVTAVQTKRPCFTAQDAGGLRSVTTCFNVHVPKCKYCVHGGDTLQFLNKRYQLNTNWLQLWNSNGEAYVF